MAQPSRRTWWSAALAACCAVTTLTAQTPQPFPGATQPPPAPRQAPVQPPPAAAPARTTAPQAPAPAQTPPPPAAAADIAPTEAQLGISVYPSAVYLRSYDAGRGQRYYVYGAMTPFTEMVNYYRNVLKEKGNLVFEVPPTHIFEIGRFQKTMAFPPSVTVKDYTFSGSGGYPNPRPGQQPERFPTLVQIVPPPAGTSPQR